MEIKDLAGFGKIFEKFMDVCASGIGKVMEPRQIRKKAEAKAYEIEKITEALSKSKDKLNSSITYENGELKLIVDKSQEEIENVEIVQKLDEQKSITNNIENIEESNTNIKLALEDKEEYKKIKKENNLYNTLNFTINEFENISKDEVSDEKVDEDWITRFFDTVENISNESLQMLWAKILAGEIKKPNTYSLRTLELLKNLSFKDAELFSRIGNLSIQNQNRTTTFIMSNKDTLEKFGINFSEILSLQDLDLIHPSSLLSYNIKEQANDTLIYLFYGKDLIKIDLKKNTKINVPSYSLTSIGVELLSLVERVRDDLYIQEFVKEVKKNTETKVYTVPLLNDKGEHYSHLFQEIT